MKQYGSSFRTEQKCPRLWSIDVRCAASICRPRMMAYFPVSVRRLYDVTIATALISGANLDTSGILRQPTDDSRTILAPSCLGHSSGQDWGLLLPAWLRSTSNGHLPWHRGYSQEQLRDFGTFGVSCRTQSGNLERGCRIRTTFRNYDNSDF